MAKSMKDQRDEFKAQAAELRNDLQEMEARIMARDEEIKRLREGFDEMTTRNMEQIELLGESRNLLNAGTEIVSLLMDCQTEYSGLIEEACDLAAQAVRYEPTQNNVDHAGGQAAVLMTRMATTAAEAALMMGGNPQIRKFMDRLENGGRVGRAGDVSVAMHADTDQADTTFSGAKHQLQVLVDRMRDQGLIR